MYKKIMMIVMLVMCTGGIAGPEVGHVSANETISQSTSTSTTSESVGDPGEVIDGRAGGYAAVGCGIFGRALGSGLHHPLVWAGAIATCAYMIVDALWF